MKSQKSNSPEAPTNPARTKAITKPKKVRPETSITVPSPTTKISQSGPPRTHRSRPAALSKDFSDQVKIFEDQIFKPTCFPRAKTLPASNKDMTVSINAHPINPTIRITTKPFNPYIGETECFNYEIKFDPDGNLSRPAIPSKHEINQIIIPKPLGAKGKWTVFNLLNIFSDRFL